MKKKVLSSVLALCMMLSILPTMASAAAPMPYIGGDVSNCKMTKAQAEAYIDVLRNASYPGYSLYATLLDAGDGTPILFLLSALGSRTISKGEEDIEKGLIYFSDTIQLGNTDYNENPPAGYDYYWAIWDWDGTTAKRAIDINYKIEGKQENELYWVYATNELDFRQKDGISYLDTQIYGGNDASLPKVSYQYYFQNGHITTINMLEYSGDTSFENLSGEYLINGKAVTEKVYSDKGNRICILSGSFYVGGVYTGVKTTADELISFLISYTKTAPVKAASTTSTILVDGKQVFPAAYTIEQNNYFKLRDLAALLSGTSTQFNVGWDGAKNQITITTDTPYTPVGGELAKGTASNQLAHPNTATVLINGKTINLTAYTINNNNYFKLRDLGKALDFNVTWDGNANKIVVNIKHPYSE